jgi:hypothetical protein
VREARWPSRPARRTRRPDPISPPGCADDVEVLADRYHRWAVVLRREGDDPHPVPGPPTGFVHAGVRAVADLPDRAEHPVRALRLVDAWGWLGWLADDLVVLERLAPVPKTPSAPLAAA